MSALGWLLIHASLIISVLSDMVPVCSQEGRFGPLCLYKCHCSKQCHRVSGKCSGTCDMPWSGPSCQRENVAFNKTAQSSGVWENKTLLTPDKVVDGNRNQQISLGHCYRSDAVFPRESVKSEAWLFVDLGRPYHTRHITVWGRYSPPDAPKRLNHTRVFVSNTPNARVNPCYTFLFTGTYSNQLIVNLTCVGEGRYVILYNDVPSPNLMNKTVLLEMCEIEVYVCTNGTYGEFCKQTCNCNKDGSCDDVTGDCTDGCRLGFQGDNCDEDTDECIVFTEPCNMTTFCANTYGSYRCVFFNMQHGVTQEPDENIKSVASGTSKSAVWIGSGVGTGIAMLLMTALCLARRKRRLGQEPANDILNAPEPAAKSTPDVESPANQENEEAHIPNPPQPEVEEKVDAKPELDGEPPENKENEEAPIPNPPEPEVEEKADANPEPDGEPPENKENEGADEGADEEADEGADKGADEEADE